MVALPVALSLFSDRLRWKLGRENLLLIPENILPKESILATSIK